MQKLIESAGVALDAIWASKLRSLMTVLGNIVAVASIIAVVSLIQGLNASVTQAILNQAGADSFSVQQYPVTRSEEEFEKVRNNPRLTLMDARAIRRYGEDEWKELVEAAGFEVEQVEHFPRRQSFDAWIQRVDTPPDAAARGEEALLEEGSHERR